MPIWLLPLLQLVVPYIAELLMAVIKTFQTNEAMQGVTGVTQEIVRGIDSGHPDWTGEQKRSAAISALDQYCIDNQWTISDSQKNLMVELAVNKEKAGPIQ